MLITDFIFITILTIFNTTMINKEEVFYKLQHVSLFSHRVQEDTKRRNYETLDTTKISDDTKHTVNLPADLFLLWRKNGLNIEQSVSIFEFILWS